MMFLALVICAGVGGGFAALSHGDKTCPHRDALRTEDYHNYVAYGR